MQDRSDVTPKDRSQFEDRVPELDQTALDRHDFDTYARYEDGDDIVICDRKNTKAWLKSDTVTELTP